MREEQKPIADWMRAMIAKHGIAARAWSEKAGVGKDTVGRSMRESYEFVTSTTTIAKLADALSEQAPGVAGAIPSAVALVPVLEEMRRALPAEGPGQAELMLALAGALRDTLLHLADEPESADDPKVSSALARASVRQLRLQSA
jgi:lambda repressor-like predicted transcriptional regulator